MVVAKSIRVVLKFPHMALSIISVPRQSVAVQVQWKKMSSLLTELLE
jgi:hypothetical protein